MAELSTRVKIKNLQYYIITDADIHITVVGVNKFRVLIALPERESYTGFSFLFQTIMVCDSLSRFVEN